MSIVIAFIVGFFGSLCASYLFPPFQRTVETAFSWISHLLDKDRFDLTGKWHQTFKEPKSGETSEWENILEVIELRHLGNRITGTGDTQDNHRKFRYNLRVVHNLAFGSYEKVGERGNITGKGVNQMIVSPDRLQMTGQATWFDHDTNRIESSQIIWEKQ